MLINDGSGLPLAVDANITQKMYSISGLGALSENGSLFHFVMIVDKRTTHVRMTANLVGPPNWDA